MNEKNEMNIMSSQVIKDYLEKISKKAPGTMVLVDLTKVNKKEDLRAIAEGLAVEYNSAVAEAKPGKAIEIEQSVYQAVNNYTAIGWEEVCTAVLSCENPMAEAIKRMVFDTIKVSKTVDKDTKLSTMSIVDGIRPIELHRLDKVAKKRDSKFGFNVHWSHMLECLNLKMTALQVIRFTPNPLNLEDKLLKIKDSYSMSTAAAEIVERFPRPDFVAQIVEDAGGTEGLTPKQAKAKIEDALIEAMGQFITETRNSIFEDFLKVASAMIGDEPKLKNILKNIHFKALEMTYLSRKKTSDSITCPNLTTFTSNVAYVLHCVLLDKEITLKYIQK